MNAVQPQRVAIAGLGSIGQVVALALARNEVPGFVLAAVSAKDHTRAKAWLDKHGILVPVRALDGLEPVADLVIECAPGAYLEKIIKPFLRAGKPAVVLSAAALLHAPHLVGLARHCETVIDVPSGAILGLDAVAAAARGRLD